MKASILTQRVIKQHFQHCSEADEDIEESEKLLPEEVFEPPEVWLRKRAYHSPKRKRRCFWVWIGRICFAVSFVLMAAFLTWVALYTGLYERDSTCTIGDWSFEPWCADALTHQNTSHLQPPLAPQQMLELRTKYQQAVGDAQSTLSSNWQNLYKDLPAPYHVRVPNSGYLIPIEIKQTANKGRGVFTNVDIKKGQKIWDNRYQAIFPNPCSAMKFFASLNNEQACDALFWSYVHNFYGNGYQTMISLDGYGYTNHGTAQDGLENIVHHFEGELSESNYHQWPELVPFVERISESTKANRNKPGAYGLYAARDISTGEGKPMERFLNVVMHVLYVLKAS